MKQHDIFAVTAPGLETVCAAELHSLGIAPGGMAVEGGVGWSGDRRSLYRANLESRTASRIVVRAGSFRARTFAELERHTARIAWSDWLCARTAVALRVTCRKSKLYHEGAVAQRVERVLADTVGATVTRAAADAPAAADASAVNGPRAADDPADAGGVQLIVVRFMRDECTISIDTSGALLHLRGYRQAVAKAPLRETLAAAMLLASGWMGGSPLLDPMCGSGTLPIEGALIARRIAPGLANADRTPRRFAFEDWPSHDERVWHDVLDSARASIRPTADIPIIGTDRDAGAVTAARANAARAGVADDVAFDRASLSAVRPLPGIGHLVTNPPYGVRIGQRRALHALYGAFGTLVRERFGGWTVAMLVADDGLVNTTGLPFDERFATSNGGIAVRLLTTPGLAS